MTTKLLEANSIPIPPRLAGFLKRALGRTGNGFDEGAFLQQLHYWTLNPETTGWIVNGAKWVYNSLKSWQAQFPWMSEYGLRKAIANLKKLGLIQTAQHWISQYRRVMFYRIDYEQLRDMAGDLCEQIARRFVESDRVDVTADRNPDPENTSNTFFPEQKTGVVLKEAGIKDACELPEQSTGSVNGMPEAGKRSLSPGSSGNKSEIQGEVFPELLAEVAQVVGVSDSASLPGSLRRAIAQFPERVRGAIAYLQYQQKQKQIRNPVGYLYEAITSGWALPNLHTSILPHGFNEWFARARAQGLVLAAMALDGIHNTLHTHRGWIPTERLMQEVSFG